MWSHVWCWWRAVSSHHDNYYVHSLYFQGPLTCIPISYLFTGRWSGKSTCFVISLVLGPVPFSRCFWHITPPPFSLPLISATALEGSSVWTDLYADKVPPQGASVEFFWSEYSLNSREPTSQMARSSGELRQLSASGWQKSGYQCSSSHPLDGQFQEAFWTLLSHSGGPAASQLTAAASKMHPLIAVSSLLPPSCFLGSPPKLPAAKSSSQALLPEKPKLGYLSLTPTNITSPSLNFLYCMRKVNLFRKFVGRIKWSN